MKSLFDNHWNDFKEVQFEKNLYMLKYERVNLIFSSGLEGAIFEQNPYKDKASYTFLMTGYEGLTPITNIDAIQKRQAVIRAFAESMQQNQNFQAIFNNLHLLTMWTSYIGEKNRYHRNLSVNSKFLERYGTEVKALVQEMAKYDNVLGELSEHYRSRFPASIIDNVVRACNQGSFDYIVMEMDPRNLKTWSEKRKNSERGKIRLHGVMGLPDKNIKGQVMLGDDKFNINEGYLVGVAANKCRSWLNKVYAPLAALFSEAYFLNNHDVCLPEVNADGVFEMVDGKPIVSTPNPVGTSLYYDKESAKVVLNGVHSGGKSHLLKTIALYHLIGLSGFSVPARSAKVPIVNRILYSFDIEKQTRGGSLESEFFDRARALESIGEGDLVLMDEFLQHASPDASTDLEPIILGEFYKTGAAVVVVTHRGDSLDDKDQWQFYSPGFTEKDGRIEPTYKFQQGKPNQEVLRRHAKQMLEDALNNEPVEEEKPDYGGYPVDMSKYHESERWYAKLGERLFGKETPRQEEDLGVDEGWGEDEIPF